MEMNGALAGRTDWFPHLSGVFDLTDFELTEGHSVCVCVCLFWLHSKKVLAQRIRHRGYIIWMTLQGTEFRVTTFRLRHATSHRSRSRRVTWLFACVRACVCEIMNSSTDTP